MNVRDRINKATFDLMCGIKDAVTAAVTNAIANGDLKIDKDQLQPLLGLISGTIEAMYHRGIRVFMRSVDKTLSDAQTTASAAAEPPKKSKPAKK